MCGRFDLHTLELIPGRYHVEAPRRFTGHYNTAPSQQSPVILDDGGRRAMLKRFGIPAPWDEKKRLINARAETVAEKRTFKKKLEEQRCLIPANGFFEWKSKNGKQPYYIRVKDEDLFSFAGVYSDDGFTILTTEANEIMAPIHDRMPVILDREEEDEWINPDLDVEQVLRLLDPFSGKLELWPVTKAVNNPRNNSETIISPAPAA